MRYAYCSIVDLHLNIQGERIEGKSKVVAKIRQGLTRATTYIKKFSASSYAIGFSEF
jgi:hypothetical protein